MFQRRLKALLPAAGRTGLFVIDALVETGGRVAEGSLAGRGGRSRYTVRRAVARLEELELVTVEKGAITLDPDRQADLERYAPPSILHAQGCCSLSAHRSIPCAADQA